MSQVLLVVQKKQDTSPWLKEVKAACDSVEVCLSKDLQMQLPLESPETILLHVQSGHGLPLELIAAIKNYDDNLPVIILSESNDIEDAVALMKAGTFDFFNFPLDVEKLKLAIVNATRMYNLTKQVFLLENRVEKQYKFDDMIGASPLMQNIFQNIRTVAKSNATVLILGESGTGKELVAQALHRHSPRAGRRFIDINCGAIPRELLENELFGHERGSFTGADRRYIGCCERADGGTLFFDEISEMDLGLQVKLLRFLQERTFCRVGGNEPIQVDVRMIAATNQNLSLLVQQGKFREDLFYRLNVVPIVLPPLRERRDDIPHLARFFLEKYAHKNEKIFLDFSQEAMEALMNHNWPGNIRELENTIERVVVLNNDSRVKWQHLPEALQKKSATENAMLPPFYSPNGDEKVLPLTLVERYAIEAALRHCGGQVAEAARKLQIGQATLYRKIKQYGLRV